LSVFGHPYTPKVSGPKVPVAAAVGLAHANMTPVRAPQLRARNSRAGDRQRAWRGTRTWGTSSSSASPLVACLLRVSSPGSRGLQALAVPR
jgi:hypothetical protein